MTDIRTQIPLVDLGAQYETIRDEISAVIDGIIQNSSFILGEPVRRFERAFADFCGVANVVGVANGTDALELVLAAHGIGPGDEVILPTLTFAATAEAVLTAGATPVLVDCLPDTLNVDPRAVSDAVSSRTRAIIAVHLYGQPADMDALRDIADDAGVPVIEDAAQAHGARWDGRPVGMFGRAATFSFFPAKNLGAYGDAGAVISRDTTLIDRIRQLANHGRIDKYHHLVSGRNSRLDALQAAVLEVKLRHLAEWTERRRRIADRYAQHFRGHLEFVTQDPRAWSVYHIYAIMADDRDRVRDDLAEQGISTGIHFPVPLHRQPAFETMCGTSGDCPVASRASERLISLPLFPELDDPTVDFIAESVIQAVKR